MAKLYKLTGARPSALPVARFCGQAAGLSSKYGTGRAAKMGTAFHALCADAPDKHDRLKELSTEERAELNSWHWPTPIEVAGVKLVYADAEKEFEVGLNENGEFVRPGTVDKPAEAITAGTVDLCWVKEVHGAKVAFVGDLKKTHWAASDGPESLQLVAYALAVAARDDVDYFAMGIWDCTEGEWLWSELYDRWSLDTAALLSTVLFAAQNQGEYTTGVHCKSCYGRLHCPEYALPASLANTRLAKFTDGNITTDNAVELALFVGAAKDIILRAEDTLKEWAKRNGGIHDPQTRKVWAPVRMTGRETADIPQLKKDLGAGAAKYLRQGSPYEQMRWLKERT